jgi:hypothetical protein
METLKSTKLIELEDGLFIEVEVPTDQAKQIASSFAERVDKTVGIIKPVLVKLCHPVSEALQEINSKLPVEGSEAEVEVNLSFTTEGNVYVTKLQSSSSLKIKLKFKPKI